MIDGELEPTLWLGAIVFAKTVVPATLRTIVYDEESNKSSMYKYAWAVWQISNMIIFGFLTILWPMTYYHITALTNFFLALFKLSTLSNYAKGAISISSLLFLFSAIGEGSWIWLFI